MSRRRTSGSVSLLVAVLSLIVWYGQNHDWFAHATAGGQQNATTSATPSQKPTTGIVKGIEQKQPGQYHVIRDVDGDTIVVDMNGTPETVRFIGVDTPETHKPNTPVQCYGPAAAAYTKHMIDAGGDSVRLAADSLSSNRDRYNRLLRYIYLPDGTLLNQNLIEQGYGFYYPYFPFSKSADFEAAEKRAQDAAKGLWGNCHPIAKDKGGYESNPQ